MLDVGNGIQDHGTLAMNSRRIHAVKEDAGFSFCTGKWKTLCGRILGLEQAIQHRNIFLPYHSSENR